MSKSNVPATQAPKPVTGLTSVGYNLPAGISFKRQVTRTVLVQEDQVPIYVHFQSAARVGDLTSDKRIKTPPRLADILNLETGELQILIMNAVLESELKRAFPEDSYAGKSFAILPHKNAGGEADRRYSTYMIIEVDVEDRIIKSAGRPPIDGTTQEAIDGTTQEAIDRAKTYPAKYRLNIVPS